MSSEQVMWSCEACGRTETVWQEDGKWLGYDVYGRTIYLEQPRTPPMPSGWLDLGTSLTCERHDVTRLKAQKLEEASS